MARERSGSAMRRPTGGEGGCRVGERPLGRGGEPAGAGPQEAAGSGTGMGCAHTRGWVCLSQRVPQQRAACVEPGVAVRLDGYALRSAMRVCPGEGAVLRLWPGVHRSARVWYCTGRSAASILQQASERASERSLGPASVGAHGGGFIKKKCLRKRPQKGMIRKRAVHRIL